MRGRSICWARRLAPRGGYANLGSVPNGWLRLRQGQPAVGAAYTELADRISETLGLHGGAIGSDLEDTGAALHDIYNEPPSYVRVCCSLRAGEGGRIDHPSGEECYSTPGISCGSGGPQPPAKIRSAQHVVEFCRRVRKWVVAIRSVFKGGAVTSSPRHSCLVLIDVPQNPHNAPVVSRYLPAMGGEKGRRPAAAAGGAPPRNPPEKGATLQIQRSIWVVPNPPRQPPHRVRFLLQRSPADSDSHPVRVKVVFFAIIRGKGTYGGVGGHLEITPQNSQKNVVTECIGNQAGWTRPIRAKKRRLTIAFIVSPPSANPRLIEKTPPPSSRSSWRWFFALPSF